jgi:hypothetical protein
MAYLMSRGDRYLQVEGKISVIPSNYDFRRDRHNRGGERRGMGGIISMAAGRCQGSVVNARIAPTFSQSNGFV